MTRSRKSAVDLSEPTGKASGRGAGHPGSRGLVAAASLLLTAGLVAACGSGDSGGGAAAEESGGGSAGGTTTVRVATNNAIGALPVLVAEEQGFFEDHGLDVTHEVVPNITLIPATLGSTYDLGYSVGPIMINAASQGIPVVAVSGNEYNSSELNTLQVIARDGISSPEDLEGKRVAAPTIVGNLNLATQHWLEENGVDPKSVTFVEVPTPTMIQQLEAGVVDAVELQYPFIPQALDKGFESLGDPILSIDDPMPMTFWMGTKTWVDENGEAADAFRDALDDAMAWITDNPDEAYQMASDFTQVPLDLVKEIPLEQFSTDYSADALQSWGDVMKEQAGFAGSVNYDDMVHDQG
jgi:NitT/TauT family transport system substrate-binding protein